MLGVKELVCLAAGLTGVPGMVHADEADKVSFRRDVMAVLSKAGCNLGVCHGNASGKGGFKLSLRGQNPQDDLETLTRALTARRVNPLDPAKSLMLLKPTMQLPHEGGRRFERDSQEYRILHAWIAAGARGDAVDEPKLTALDVKPAEQTLIAPESSVQITAVARFSDGSWRDVTSLAVYEPANRNVTVGHDGLATREAFGETTVIVRYLDRQAPVRLAFVPARPDFVWSAPEASNFVDEHVFAKLKRLRMNPSEVCDDVTFLRRATLDLTGLLPTADEARRFLADDDPQKRARLVDELLARPAFAELWALYWSDLLRSEEKTLDRKGVEHFHAWLRAAFARNQPLDEFARALIASRGSTYSAPESNYYRAMRDPFMRAESTAQLFLGVRLKCAKCHNHPFDRWTQDDYYSWANLFARVDYKILENNRRDRNDKHEFDGEQIVFIKREGDVEDPRTGNPLAPRFLGGQEASEDRDRLRALAVWLASADNPFFARAQVNRVWSQLMRRGIVDPIDDFRATNPPANPPLLAALADDFVAHGFDLRHLIRTIMQSRTYQLAAEPNRTNQGDEANFSHALVRRLPAEQLLDAVAQVLDAPLDFTGYPPRLRAGQIPGVRAIRPRDKRPSSADQFLKLFGKPPRLQSCACERTDESTLSQAFQLVSGEYVNELLAEEDNRLGDWLESGLDERALVTELYWTALSRPPVVDELEVAADYLRRADNRRTALEDLAWSLLNSNEFLLRR